MENADGTPAKAPRAVIEELADALSVDPAKILLAKPKELAALLLEVMPIQFGRDELQEALDEKVWPVSRDMSLEGVEELRRQIYETRTTANRQAKEAETTANSLRRSLPENDGQDWGQRVSELRQLLEEAKYSREADIKAIDRAEREAIDDIRAESQRRMDAAKAEARDARAAKDTELEPTLAKINAALGEAEERLRDKDRAQGVHQSLELFTRQANNATEQASHLSTALERLDELKARRLSSLPIPGMEVRDGQVFYNGVAFEHINLRARIELAFQICALRNNGKLPFMLLDEAEAFDSESWEAFKEGVQNSGFQVIAARVSDGPLAIEVLGNEVSRQGELVTV